MAADDDLIRLEEDFSRMAVTLFESGTVDQTLLQVVALAQDAIDGCEAAGVLAIDEHDAARTVASGHVLAERMDRIQIQAEEGPCLDAARGGITCYAEDLLDEPRWPVFVREAKESGVRCVLAYSLSAQHMSALNLYASLPAAFGAIDRAKGQLFATLARLAIDSAEALAAEEFRSTGLDKALQTRELIGQAQGILMEREHITAEQAFDVLRRASQHLNVKLREVAATLVETGETPDTGPERGN